MCGCEGRAKHHDACPAHPCNGIFGRGRHHRHRKDAANTGTDGVGVVDVGLRIADDHGVEVCGIGRAQEGTQVSRFFNGFKNKQQGCFPQAEIAEFKPFGFCQGNKPVAVLAVSHAVEDIGSDFDHLHPAGRWHQRSQFGIRNKFWGEKKVGKNETTRYGQPDFAQPFDDDPVLFLPGAGFLAEQQHILDKRV